MISEKQINHGQFFTPSIAIDKVYDLLSKHNIKTDFIIDNACGNGDFYRGQNNFYGVDIDPTLQNNWLQVGLPNNHFIVKNSLLNTANRSLFNIQDTQSVLMIGNPPYNNLYSQYQRAVKTTIDSDMQGKDLGIQFLNAYDQIWHADYICVLHPLAYLIKKTNFQQLKTFFMHYKLLDNFVISSTLFDSIPNSKTPFPIVIALYQRDLNGTTWDDLTKTMFYIDDTNYSFCLNQFLFIEDVHTKYKDKTVTLPYKHFFTIRDLNHLAINKGWLTQEDHQSIRVTKQNEVYFDYLMFLKQWFKKHQKEFYFLGNLSPFLVPTFYHVQYNETTDAEFTKWTKTLLENNHKEKTTQ